MREIVEGKIQGNERGYGFLIPSDGRATEYFIPHSDLRGAMHGDTVIAETTTEQGGERTVAKVKKILTRGITEIVGSYKRTHTGGFVTSDDKRFFSDVFIPAGKGLKAKTGDKVACKILSYPQRRSPEGVIIKVFGGGKDRFALLKSIIYSYKLPEKFPIEVLNSAKIIDDVVSDDQIIGRRDFRSIFTATIDGEDARDFDDAISIEKLADGYRLYVHIADVSEYVLDGDAIDKEAYARGTSVYFPETVLPMLPEKLCNGICSLNEGVDRLTLTCIMKVDDSGKVVDYEIVKGVINSNARLTYTGVEKVLDGEDAGEKYTQTVKEKLFEMYELSKILGNRREKNGSIDLDVKESLITVLGGEISVGVATRDKAHSLIEEFMLLANVTVAEYIYYLDKPCVYRVHEKPTPEKVENFYEFLRGINVPFKRKRDEIFSKDFQTILKKVEGSEVFTLVNRVMLRSMQKAKYSSQSLGHFGLSEARYCHFTSPIRRYPDLTVHRILKGVLDGKDVDSLYGEKVDEISAQSSERERIAVDAERAVDEFYKMLYLENFVDEEFDGVVSGVVKGGLFVEIVGAIEGFVKIPEWQGVNYDKKNFSLTVGKTNYRLGSKVRIVVDEVDLINRRAEFLLVKSKRD